MAENCVLNQETPAFCPKIIFSNEIGLGACDIAWILPAMQSYYHGLCNKGPQVSNIGSDKKNFFGCKKRNIFRVFQELL